ncbi:MAG: hypothetical protein AAGM22_04945 [Acidobacteriota bacterium]
MTETLPHGLADGLHVLEPSSIPWGWALFLGLCALALWLWRRRRRQRPPAAPRPAPAPSPAPRPEPAGGIIARIEALRKQYRDDRRAGVHALASVTRSTLDTGSGAAPSKTLTALEISSRFSGPIGRLMMQISELQWRRLEPSEREFERVFDFASSLLGARALGRGANDR